MATPEWRKVSPDFFVFYLELTPLFVRFSSLIDEGKVNLNMLSKHTHVHPRADQSAGMFAGLMKCYSLIRANPDGGDQRSPLKRV